jgi:hypothetical protein
LGKAIALRFEIVRFLKKPALYALKTLNFKLTLPSLAYNQMHAGSSFSYSPISVLPRQPLSIKKSYAGAIQLHISSTGEYLLQNIRFEATIAKL